jgi:hypothetical protein
VRQLGDDDDAFWRSRGVRVLTVVTFALILASTITYDAWLTSATNRFSFTDFSIVIAAILIGWLMVLLVLNRRFGRSDPLHLTKF